MDNTLMVSKSKKKKKIVMVDAIGFIIHAHNESKLGDSIN